MKVSEPFSGYSLARGHIVFHIALFAGSFFVSEPYVQEMEKDDSDN